MRSHEKRRAKLALADEDCQYDGGDYDEARSLREKTIVARWRFNGRNILVNRRTACRMLKKSVRQGHSERGGEGVRSGTLSF